MREKLALAVSNSQSSSLYVKAGICMRGRHHDEYTSDPFRCCQGQDAGCEAAAASSPLAAAERNVRAQLDASGSCNRCSHFNFSTVAEHAVLKERSWHFSRGVTSGIGSNMGALSVMRSIVRTDGFWRFGMGYHRRC